MEELTPEKRFRRYEVNTLYLMFKSYGYEIPMRKISYLQRLKKIEKVDIKEFMADSGYACCDQSIDALREGYRSWNASRITMEEFLEKDASASGEDSEESNNDSDQ